MLRVLIADDHPVFREGLKQIINETNDLMVARESSDGFEALKQLREGSYDLALLDISLPDINGIEILKHLKTEKIGIPVLILTMHPEEQYAIRALKAGASGYLTKESTPNELVTAIRKISKGGKYISSSLAEKLASEVGRIDVKASHEMLSDREYQIMLLIASGKTVSQIAERLSLSIKTISTYRSRILEKMGMQTNAELTYFAIKNQLVD
ncbi:MAG: response regulator transcription factor [Dehalococcoidia bacterium]|nr:MAG: response regulator transcription factor [Dehalococcoidia bacterium]